MNQLMNQPGVKPPRPKQKKRWWAHKVVSVPLVCLSTVLTIVVVAVGSFYAWAYCSTSSSVVARQSIWQTPANVDDYQRFPARTIATASPTFSFPRAPAGNPYTAALRSSLYYADGGLAQFLASNQTTSFLVIKGGQILYEGYFNGYSEQSTVTSFSVAKSVLSALVGIAIEQGAIGSVQDPITKYLPELAKRDARFGAITIQDLLTMSSGLAWHPNQDNPGIWGNSLSDPSLTYYDPNLRALALQHTQIGGAPATAFEYNPYNALLIGMILERATHQSISHYLQEQLWKPLGMEAPGSWSLDSTQDGFEKSESGLNGRAIDFAKFGQLFLQGGAWQGRQLIPASWVKESTSALVPTSPGQYAYFWWLSSPDGKHVHYYAYGNLGQYLYVVPEQQLVFVRFGTDYGGVDWPSLFEQLSAQIQKA
jgi:CubicO group peptidase (beta-lactamase class C family)